MRCHHRVLRLINIFIAIVDLINSLKVSFERVQMGKDAHHFRHQYYQASELSWETTVDARVQLPSDVFILVREQDTSEKIVTNEVKRDSIENQDESKKDPVFIV